MHKKVIFSVFALFLMILSTNAFAEPYFNKNHPLRSLIINKAAFDATCDTIILTLSKIPECEDCPAARIAAKKLYQAAKRLEKINDRLFYAIPDPKELMPNERAATGVIYRSIVYNSDSIIGLIESIGGLSIAGLVAAGASDSGDIGRRADDATCNPIISQDDCTSSGCSWCTEYSGSCEEMNETNHNCCYLFTNEFECYNADCDWHIDTAKSYCTSLRGCPTFYP